MSSDFVVLQILRFPEFNCNMIIAKHPMHIIDSTSLWYKIIFGADFLDKCRISFDYENNIVWWMEYIPFCNTAELFLYSYYSCLFTTIEINL